MKYIGEIECYKIGKDNKEIENIKPINITNYEDGISIYKNGNVYKGKLGDYVLKLSDEIITIVDIKTFNKLFKLSELLNCKCGEVPSLISTPKGNYIIQCLNCNRKTIPYTSKDEAYSSWNKMIEEE